MRYLMNGMQVDQKIASTNDTSLEHCLSLLKKSSVGSLAVNDCDQSHTYKLQRFLRMSQQVEHYSAQGHEAFPGELLMPKRDMPVTTNMLDRLVEFYQRAYADTPFSFRRPFSHRQHGDITVRPQATQYGRLQISGETFGSVFSGRSNSNAYILARFINQHDIVETYPGQVQYYLEHTIVMNGLQRKHYLAYVRWYKQVSVAEIRFHLSPDKHPDNCLAELWDTEFSEEAADCILPIHNILGRFLPSTIEVNNRRGRYLAAVPLNRHFYI